MSTPTKFPFEATFDEIRENPDVYVAAVFESLESEFLVLPKGPDFLEYPVFASGYERLKKQTREFADWDADRIADAVFELPAVLTVTRTILGFTPPEWAHVASQRTDAEISQGYARSLDRIVRASPDVPLKKTPVRDQRIRALVQAACELVTQGIPPREPGMVHRLDKADTQDGVHSVKSAARLGVPYPMLLYERYLGRPFAAHRDSVSELVGDAMESAIESLLTEAGVSFRKTGRAKRIPGFDQAPDFVIPDEFDPQVVIEAKITEDDGTARDKATRIQHLGELAMRGQPDGKQKFEVIACIDGRGFGVRAEDMKKILFATGGKVYSFQTLRHLVATSALHRFRTG